MASQSWRLHSAVQQSPLSMWLRIGALRQARPLVPAPAVVREQLSFAHCVSTSQSLWSVEYIAVSLRAGLLRLPPSIHNTCRRLYAIFWHHLCLYAIFCLPSCLSHLGLLVQLCRTDCVCSTASLQLLQLPIHTASADWPSCCCVVVCMLLDDGACGSCGQS